MLKVRKACDMHVLAQIWATRSARPLTVRFGSRSSLLLRLLTLRLEGEMAGSKFKLGAPCQLVFRVNNSCLVGQVRVLLKVSHLLFCALPTQLQIKQVRTNKRSAVLFDHGLVCEFTKDRDLFVDSDEPAEARLGALRRTVDISDISAGGMRLKLMNTKRSTVFHVGQSLAGLVLKSVHSPSALRLECEARISNIVVRDDWETNLESGLAERQRSTFLGLVFAPMGALNAGILERILMRVEQGPVMETAKELRLIADRGKGMQKDL